MTSARHVGTYERARVGQTGEIGFFFFDFDTGLMPFSPWWRRAFIGFVLRWKALLDYSTYIHARREDLNVRMLVLVC